MATKRRGKLVPKTKIASNWLSEEETPKARKKDTYKCFCNKRYSSAAYLARHILKHHAPTNGASTEDASALQEGNRQETSSTEIPGPVPSSDASTKNTSQEAGARVEEGTSSVPSPGIIGKSKSTKAPKKKLKTKGRAKPASSYKYRNRQQKAQAKPAARLPSQSDTITPKIEIDVDNLELGDAELVHLGEDGTRDLDTTVDSFPQSVYDFDDASDDEGVADLPEFKGEDFEDDVSDKEDSKENILNETVMSLGATSTSGICTPGSTPGKKRVTKTYQGGMMKRLHACHICTKTYSSVGKLKRHMKSHTEEGQKRLFTCGICQKSFNSNSVLIAHIRVHTGEKPFKCDECKMAFKQTSHLNRHKRVHSGEKPFTCEICNKGFPHNFNLVIHRRKHTGEKPYVCNVCNHPFADRSNLNKHMPRCLKRLCEQIDVIGSLDDSSDEFGSERRKKNAINKIKSEFTQGDIDDNLFEDDMHFPVTYEQVITQAVEEAPGTSAYMDEASFQTAEEGSSYGLGDMEGHGMGPSLIGQIEPSRMMREVDVTFVEEESTDGDFAKKFRKKDPNKKGDFTLTDTSTPRKRPRPKQSVGFPAPKRQATPKRRSPKKSIQTSDKEVLDQHSILPHNIFQEDSNEGVGPSHLSHSGRTGGRRDESPGHTGGSDFAMLAEQILDDHLPMESESNLTAELLIPVDSGWIEQSKNRAKGMMQLDRRPPPVSELFKLTRPPEMDDNLSGPISPSYPPVGPISPSYPPASAHSLTWSSQMSAPPSMPTPASTSSAQITECVVLPSIQDKPTEYTTMEIDQPFHSSPSLLSPTHARSSLSPSALGAEVEEVYAHYPDTNYDQGLEVDTKNIIISEPDRNY